MWLLRYVLTLGCVVLAFASLLLGASSVHRNNNLPEAGLGIFIVTVALALLVNFKPDSPRSGVRLIWRLALLPLGSTLILSSVWCPTPRGYQRVIGNFFGSSFRMQEGDYKRPWESRHLVPVGVQSLVLSVTPRTDGSSTDPDIIAPKPIAVGVFWEVDLGRLKARPELIRELFSAGIPLPELLRQNVETVQPPLTTMSQLPPDAELDKWNRRVASQLFQRFGIRLLGSVVLAKP